MMMTRLFTALTLLLILGGCVRPDPQESLDDYLKLYAKALRWGHYDMALSMTYPEDIPLDQSAVAHLRNYKVTGYEELQRQLGADGESATVVAEISYVDLDGNRVRTVLQRQSWLFQEERERWYLSNGLPTFH